MDYFCFVLPFKGARKIHGAMIRFADVLAKCRIIFTDFLLSA